MTRHGCRWLVTLALLAALRPAAAAPVVEVPPEEGEEWMARQAIQNRKHTLKTELSVAIGTLPVDAMYKGLTANAQLTYHFGTVWAWEIFNFGYSKAFWTSLRRDLEENWRNPASPQVIPEIQFFGDSNLVFKPFYGKLAYLNRSLVYGEFFLVAGPAVAWYDTDKDRLAVGGDVGFGFRVHLTPRWSVRLDVRYYRFQTIVKKDTRGDDVLFLQLGIALNVGGGSR
jgi:outer membrane beta-barrel protein